MANILVVDADAELFGNLESCLAAEDFRCVHAATPQKGFQALAAGAYDALILGVMLPEINGFEVLRRLRADESTSFLPVLVLTSRGEEIDRVVGLEMGADDYMPKPFSQRELVARLRALLRRSAQGRARQLSGAVQYVGDIRINRNSLHVSVGDEQRELTVPELRLLNLLAQSVGEVVGRDFLRKSIFGHRSRADRSLDMLVSRLRKKLGPRPDGGERIKAVRGEGYVYILAGDSK